MLLTHWCISIRNLIMSDIIIYQSRGHFSGEWVHLLLTLEVHFADNASVLSLKQSYFKFRTCNGVFLNCVLVTFVSKGSEYFFHYWSEVAISKTHFCSGDLERKVGMCWILSMNTNIIFFTSVAMSHELYFHAGMHIVEGWFILEALDSQSDSCLPAHHMLVPLQGGEWLDVCRTCATQDRRSHSLSQDNDITITLFLTSCLLVWPPGWNVGTRPGNKQIHTRL